MISRADMIRIETSDEGTLEPKGLTWKDEYDCEHGDVYVKTSKVADECDIFLSRTQALANSMNFKDPIETAIKWIEIQKDFILFIQTLRATEEKEQ